MKIMDQAIRRAYKFQFAPEKDCDFFQDFLLKCLDQKLKDPF